MRTLLVVALASTLFLGPAWADEPRGAPTDPASAALEEARAEVARAEALRRAGDLGGALGAHRRAVATLDRHRIQTPETARMLNGLGSCLHALRRYTEARQVSLRALALQQSLLGGDHADLLLTLDDLAAIHRGLGRPLEALSYRTEALAIARRLHEGDHPDVAVALDELARDYGALGRHAEALPLTEEEVAMRRRLHQEANPELAASLDDLALAYRRLGRRTDSLRLREEALAVRRDLHEGDHSDVAFSLDRVALAHSALGRPGEAVPLLEESLAMYRRLYDGDHPSVAITLSTLAHVQGLLGRHVEALPLEEEALAMRRRLHPGDHATVARSLNNLGYTYGMLARYDEALGSLDAALSMRRRLSTDDHAETARFLSNVAQTLLLLGRHAEALGTQQEALAMYRRLFPRDHPQVASALGNLAGVLSELGRHFQALPLYRESLAMQRRLAEGDHPDLAKALNDLAACHDAIGRHADAVPFLEEALAMQRRLFPADHPDIARGLGNLAQVHRALGRAENALPLELEALAIHRRTFEGDHPSVAHALQSLAGTFLAIGRPRDALPLGEESLDVHRRLFPGDHPAVARSLDWLSGVHLELGHTARALSLQTEAIAMLRRLFDVGHPATARALHKFARTQYRIGQPAAAVTTWRKSAALGRDTGWSDRHLPLAALARYALITKNVEAAIPDLEEAIAHLEARWEESRSLGAEVGIRHATTLRRADPYPLMVEAQVALERPDAALGYLERGRARALLDLLARGRSDPAARAAGRARQTGDRELLTRLVAAQRAVANAEAVLVRRTAELERSRSGGEREEIRSAAKAENAARKTLAEAARQRLHVVRDALPETRPLSPTAIQSLIGPNERMLVYGLGSRRSYVFVVGSQRIQAFELESYSEDAVRAYVDVLSKRGGATAEEGRALFETLIPPRAWEEVRRASRVYVLPHGLLHTLPFEALVVDAQGRYWVDGGPPIVYAASGALLASLRERSAPGGPLSLVALGDPIFDGSTSPWPERGVLVKSVVPGGQAAALGLRPGDVITGYGDREIDGFDTLPRAAANPGGRSSIPLRILRDDVMRTFQVSPGGLGVRIARAPPPVAGPRLLERSEVSTRLRSARSYRDGLVPLPGTRKEVEQIAAAFRDADDQAEVVELLGRWATEGALYEAAEGVRFVHLATHGVIDETQGAGFSGLALTLPRVPVPGDDGFLTLVDILERWQGRLANAELVVLSSCESRRGSIERDEGMLALPWGFCFAGCRGVVGSLWKVEDDSTAIFMTEFYRRLLETGGRDKARALQQARRAVRKTHPDPYHWAPFVFLGDPR